MSVAKGRGPLPPRRAALVQREPASSASTVSTRRRLSVRSCCSFSHAMLRPWPVGNNQGTHQGQRGPQILGRIGDAPLDDSAPQQRSDDEQTAVSGVDAGEIEGRRLQGGQQAVWRQGPGHQSRPSRVDAPRAATATSGNRRRFQPGPPGRKAGWMPAWERAYCGGLMPRQQRATQGARFDREFVGVLIWSRTCRFRTESRRRNVSC